MNFDGIYNYYERLVYDNVIKIIKENNMSASNDNAEDIACLALNKLPARYVRHSVDAAFYLSGEEREKMISAVNDAVNSAFEQVKSHPGKPD